MKFYGQFLTPRQWEITESYYDYDLSLKEIAENTGISRQAVLDAVHTSAKELQRFEEILGLYEVIDALKRIDACMTKDEIINIIKSILSKY